MFFSGLGIEVLVNLMFVLATGQAFVRCMY